MKKSCSWLLIALGLIVASAEVAEAQETQVPLDSAGRVEVIDARLRERLGLFPGRYPGFREARLFQAADSAFVLEITSQREGRLIRERVPLSAAEVGVLRRQVGGSGMTRPPGAPDARAPGVRAAEPQNQEGRYLLLAQTTLLGAMVYGTTVPTALGIEDGTAFASTALLTTAASFFVPYALTQNRPVTSGMANLSRYGVTRGALHGVLAYYTLAGSPDDDDGCTYNPELGYEECDYYGNQTSGSAQVLAAATLAGSLAEAVAGYRWARNENMSAGRAATISNVGDLGLAVSAGGAAALYGENVDERLYTATILAGGIAGVAAGHRYSQSRPALTWGDAQFQYTAGALGAYTALALLGAAETDNGRAYGAGIALGALAGAAVADRLVRETDFTVGQAALNQLGTLTGAVAGAAVGVLAQEWHTILVGSAAGAVIGYALTYSTLAPDARQQRGERFSSWDVRLSPAAVLALGRQPTTARITRRPLPLLTFERRF